VNRSIVAALASAALALGTIVAVPSPSFAQTAEPILWGGIRDGMTIEQLQGALPGATLHSDGKTIVGAKTTILGSSFDIFVTTTGGRTQRVELQGTGALANDLRASLTAKYGEAISPYRCQSLSIIRICEQSWAGTSSVKVSITQMTSAKGSVVTIRYETLDTGGL